MNGKEILALLTSYKDSIQDFDILEVVVVTGDKCIGPSAAVNVKVIYPGFDWNIGKLMITTEPNVIKKPLGSKTRKFSGGNEIKGKSLEKC